ncbi:recombinase family protein [Nocardia sp. NPDC050710]|uniref:recombinase family protein n=1 Tax=Nocardia sp. NPDC050710 TaxID=3157220 RepID=UPI0033E3563D
MRTKPTAIGYLRKDVSGISQEWDEIQIRSRAQRLGYDLAKIVVFGPHTDRPLMRLMNVARTVDVDAVIVPSLAHFGDQVPAELVRLYELNTVTPQNTYTQRYEAFRRAEWTPSATTLGREEQAAGAIRELRRRTGRPTRGCDR